MIKVAAIILTLAFATSAHSEVCTDRINNNKQKTILFVNGILNDDIAACNSAVSLRQSLAAEGLATAEYNYDTFVNTTDGGFGDVTELRLQAAISSAAKKANTAGTRQGYYTKLGGIYRTLIAGNANCDPYISYINTPEWNFVSTELLEVVEEYSACQRISDITQRLANTLAKYAIAGGVIVVPHSQGNFYTEAAYSLLLEKGFGKIAKIKVAGVAAISQYPVDDRYLTISQDNALFLLQKINTSGLKDLQYTPAKTDTTACATYLPCTNIPGGGQNEDVLGKLTKSVGIRPALDADGWIKSGAISLIRGKIPQESRYLFHEFVEVYLNTKILDAITRKTLPAIIEAMVFDASNELDRETMGNLIPHTGITASQCYKAGSNNFVSCSSPEALALNDQQDGMRASKNPMSYREVGGYSRTYCILDVVTGLMWEGKPNTGLRAGSLLYTNYGDNRTGDISAYVTYVNTIGLCGHTDWRVPNADELYSTVNLSINSVADESIAALDKDWFPGPIASIYHTSSSFNDIASTRLVTVVGMRGGSGREMWTQVNPSYSYVVFGARLVRSQQ